MDLNKEILISLNESDLSLEEYFVLWSKANSLGLLKYYRINDKIYKKLMDKNFLSLSKTITKNGRQKLNNITGNTEENKNFTESFRTWWELYPSSDKWDRFPRTRSIRGNKESAKVAYGNAIQKVASKYKITDKSACLTLSESLEKYINSKRLRSLSSGSNEFKYIPSALKWLRNEEYLIWSEDSQTNSNKKKPKDNKVTRKKIR